MNEYKNVLRKYDPESTDYLVDVHLYTEPTEEELRSNPKMKLWKIRLLYIGQATIQQLTLIGTNTDARQNIRGDHESVSKLLNAFSNKLLTISEKSLGHEPTPQEKNLFKKMEVLIRTDDNINSMYSAWGDNYIHGIYIHKVRSLNINAPKYDPKTSKNVNRPRYLQTSSIYQLN